MTMQDVTVPDLHGAGASGSEEPFERVLRLARRIFAVPIAAVTLVGRERTLVTGDEITRTPTAEDPLCSATLTTGRVLVVEDTTADARFATLPYVTGDPHVRFYAGQTLLSPGGERVGTLCIADVEARTFTASEAALLHDLAEWVEAELAVDEELERATQVQASMLPRSAPSVPGFDVAGACLAPGVGGDFFDWRTTPDGLVLSIADVMGTGPAASILAASVRAVLRASDELGDVARALQDAGAVLYSDLTSTGFFATAFHARLDDRTGRLTFADAGHGLTLHVRADGRCTRVAALDLPLGVFAAPQHRTQVLTLAPGDLLVTFSDGLVERFANSADCLPAVEDVVREARSAQQAVDAVLRLAAEGGSRTDDVTVLALRRDDTGPDAL